MPEPVEDGFSEWMARDGKLQSGAKNEDFVRHHLAKYGPPLPIWVAVEFLDSAHCPASTVCWTAGIRTSLVASLACPEADCSRLG